MAQIGNLGTAITFQVSSKKVLTFQNLTQKTAGRWTEHNSIGSKPKSEFLGADLRDISFKVVLSAALGVSPRKTIENIAAAIESGEAMALVIGGRQVGGCKWVITNMSEVWDCVYTRGELAKATISLTLKEYVEVVYDVTAIPVKEIGEAPVAGGSGGKSYTIKPGDTLWMLAKANYGAGKQYTKIYNANKDIIEAAAKAHGKKSSDNGHWIYPGTVITIPA